jgi:ferredoxin
MAKALKLDPIACDAHGLCAELLPELIVLDDWGYPIIAEGTVPPDLEPLARKAVAVCPTLALKLQRADQYSPGHDRRADRADHGRDERPRAGHRD